ncbi:MAG: YihY/virulence factor BrkB family protein [Gemmatimonadaceae bacterium]|nr:YihY/virulence factor BrkB family protein [Gemmatimonadaceae bacterium]
MPRRPFLIRIYWSARDYAKRVWDNSGEDNIFFLAGGIAFNLLLAAVPFLLLLVAGMATILHQPTAASSVEINALLDKLMPPHSESTSSPIHGLLDDIITARGAIRLYSAIGFIWFSTRLFGSLRSVLAEVFDIEQDRGIIDGKIFDIKITIIATLLLVGYTALNAYLAVATTRGFEQLTAFGMRTEVMGQLEYLLGRTLAFLFIGMMFFALYKFIPNRRIRWQTALVAAGFTSAMFEIARNVFSAYVRSFNPGSLYTGALTAIVVVVIWVYYAALIFILGGEVGQVFELRRVRKMQREVFTE